MLAGIIGDVVGSVYEAYQWQKKDLPLIGMKQTDNPFMTPLFKEAKWVRQEQSWTDDTLCTVALYHAYINNQDPKDALLYFCNKYKSDAIGFGGAFMQWLENPVPYQSYGNGSLMRVGFIPFLNIPLEQQLNLGYFYTAVSHDHPDSFEAVRDFIFLMDKLGNQLHQPIKDKTILKQYLEHFDSFKTVEQLHQEFVFELNAKKTFFQAISIVYESNSMQEVLINSMYVGGDSDTLACIACNLASRIYECPPELMTYALNTLKNAPEIESLVQDFNKKYWITQL